MENLFRWFMMFFIVILATMYCFLVKDCWVSEQKTTVMEACLKRHDSTLKECQELVQFNK
jgi:hypothetical protein